jgi:alpha-glucoside transport system ATP-binding protein
LGEVTLLYFQKSAPDHDPVIGKLAGIHPGLRGKSVRLTAKPEKVHVFKDGISLLHRDETVFLPGVQPH